MVACDFADAVLAMTAALLTPATRTTVVATILHRRHDGLAFTAPPSSSLCCERRPTARTTCSRVAAPPSLQADLRLPPMCFRTKLARRVRPEASAPAA